jgi:hypothetical protein
MTDDDAQKLINAFIRLPSVKRQPPFLTIAGCPHRETVWENILAFFLNPRECHGFNELVLQSLFDAIAQKKQTQVQLVGDIQSIEVYTECQTKKGRLDLLIQGNGYVIGIEMKVHAGLYNDLEDYADYIDKQAQSGETAYKVVLSLRECGAIGNGFINLLWSDLISSIKSNMGSYLLAAHPKYTTFFIDFLEHVQSQGGQAMSNDEKKRLKFMQDNYQTIQEIVKEHEKFCIMIGREMEQLCEFLAQRLKQEGMTIRACQPVWIDRGKKRSLLRVWFDNGVQVQFLWDYPNYYQVRFDFCFYSKGYEFHDQKVHAEFKPQDYTCFGEEAEEFDTIASKIGERAMGIIEAVARSVNGKIT